MLRNLEAEMVRNNIKKKDLAEALGINTKSCWNKINGVTDFTFPEATLIQEKFFPSLELQYLFANDEQEE